MCHQCRSWFTPYSVQYTPLTLNLTIYTVSLRQTIHRFLSQHFVVFLNPLRSFLIFYDAVIMVQYCPALRRCLTRVIGPRLCAGSHCCAFFKSRNVQENGLISTHINQTMARTDRRNNRWSLIVRARVRLTQATQTIDVPLHRHSRKKRTAAIKVRTRIPNCL